MPEYYTISLTVAVPPPSQAKAKPWPPRMCLIRCHRQIESYAIPHFPLVKVEDGLVENNKHSSFDYY